MPPALIHRHTNHSRLLPGFSASSHTSSEKPQSTTHTICFIIHLRCTWVVFSEMTTHTPLGNNFRVKRLFLAPFAFSLRLRSFLEVLRSASFSPSPVSWVCFTHLWCDSLHSDLVLGNHACKRSTDRCVLTWQAGNISVSDSILPLLRNYPLCNLGFKK